jgi:hypothetical protein
MLKRFAAVLAIAAALAAPAAAAPQVGPEEEAQIPFLHLSRLTRFHSAGEDTVYIRGPGRQWYRATTLGPCLNLPWALAIGVDTRGAPTLDRFSSLIVEGERCPLQSVVKSGPPPRKERRGRS